jgi:hypothetical protein
MIDKLEKLTPEEYKIVREFIHSLEPADFIEMVSMTTGWCIAMEDSTELIDGIIMGPEEWIVDQVSDIDKFNVMEPPAEWFTESAEQEDLPVDTQKGRLN